MKLESATENRQLFDSYLSLFMMEVQNYPESTIKQGLIFINRSIVDAM